MRKFALTDSDCTEIDMTPMLDIVFIMLIFFIVTSSFVKASALELQRPSGTPPTGPVSTLVLLELTADNRIINSGRELDSAAVPALLEESVSRDASTRVVIQAHHDSQTEPMLKLVGQAKAVGIAQVSVGEYTGS